MSSLLFPVYSPGIRWQRWPQYCYRIKIKSSRRPGPRVLSLNRMINMWEAGGTFLLRSHGDLETCVYTIMSPPWPSDQRWLDVIGNIESQARGWSWIAWTFYNGKFKTWFILVMSPRPDPSNGVKLGQKPPARAPAPGLIPPGSPRPMTRARSRRLRCQFSLIKHHKMRQKTSDSASADWCTAFIFTASARGINILKWSLSFLQVLILRSWLTVPTAEAFKLPSSNLRR